MRHIILFGTQTTAYILGLGFFIFLTYGFIWVVKRKDFPIRFKLYDFFLLLISQLVLYGLMVFGSSGQFIQSISGKSLSNVYVDAAILGALNGTISLFVAYKNLEGKSRQMVQLISYIATALMVYFLTPGLNE